MRSVAQLAADARDYTFNTDVSLRSWLHVARSVLREAHIYLIEGDSESAYVLQLRYADLVLNRLPQHPDISNAVLGPLGENVKAVLASAEQLRMILEARPARQTSQASHNMATSLGSTANSIAAAGQSGQSQYGAGIGGQRPSQQMPLQPELPGRPRTQQKQPQLQTHHHQQPQQPYKTDRSPLSPVESSQDHARVLPSLPQSPDLGQRLLPSQPSIYRPEFLSTSSPPDFGDTLAALKRPLSYLGTANFSSSTKSGSQGSSSYSSFLPPNKIPVQPLQPSRYALSGAVPTISNQGLSLRDAAPVPPSHTKEHKATASTEGGAPLRTLFLPEGLRLKFLQCATTNTQSNLETAGVLCGRLSRNAFFITHLVIPPQESTSDTCATTDEEKLFCYLDERNLFVLGWIHTHPTQSCFLSSIDLHTQSSYQTMLPEAVAVVCSPRRDPSWGAFRLTDPRGIDIIKACPRSGFHPHPERDIYRKAIPGHMRLLDTPFETADLR